jgi:hypothetical protein
MRDGDFKPEGMKQVLDSILAAGEQSDKRSQSTSNRLAPTAKRAKKK